MTSQTPWAIFTKLSAKSADENLGESLVLDKPDATIGLQYRVPIGNHSAKSRISRVDLEIERLQREIDEIEEHMTNFRKKEIDGT